MLGRIVPTDLPFNLRYDWSRGKDANGWSPTLVDDIDEGERARRTANTALSHRDILGNLALGEAQVRALREALTLCRQNGIAAALVRMPEATAYRAMYPLDVSKRIAGFLNLLADEYGCRLCNASGWMSDDSFSDGHHLLRRAAGPFSTRLTCEIIEPMLKDLIDNPR
jgi:hypothetical protein